MAIGLVSGAVLLLVGSICAAVGTFIAADCCNLNFRLLEWCVTAARQIPGSHFWVPGPADWWLWGFYGGLGLAGRVSPLSSPAPLVRGAVGRLDRGRVHGRPMAAAIATGWIARFSAWATAARFCWNCPPARRCSTTPARWGRRRPAAAPISEALWMHGTTHLDAVVLSHADIDHYNALPGLLEKFSVGAVYVSPVMFDKENQAMTALRSGHRASTGCRSAKFGPAIGFAAARAACWKCSTRRAHGIVGSDNANSLVLSVEYRAGESCCPAIWSRRAWTTCWPRSRGLATC